jgi:hypothetical protein
VLSDDYLFGCGRVSPFLMASRLANENEPVPLQNSGNLIGGEARRSAITQP